ncbi:MAG: 4Fe-4S binding protein [Acholeplasmataceae bacterium]|jgi:ferredoxin|nr:4Fe-4S binding protein [Acholeplasmataceae bacterium]
MRKTGIPSLEAIRSCFPDTLVKPKAIIECYEEIPCNPCATSCPVQAITIGEDLNKQPRINFDLCTGCGICISSCPGLAIMVAEEVGEQIRFKIPYEFLPVPEVGENWLALNRQGEVIGEALIEKVLRKNKTLVVSVLVPRDLLYEFISIRRPK